MNKTCLTVLILLLVVPVSADWLTHESTGLELWIPDDWDYEYDGDLLLIQESDQDLLLVVLVSDAGTIEAFTDEMVSLLERYVANPEVTERAEAIEVNGLAHYYMEGTGEFEGEAIDWDLTFVVGARKGMVLIGVGDIETHQETLDRIYNSVRLSE